MALSRLKHGFESRREHQFESPRSDARAFLLFRRRRSCPPPLDARGGLGCTRADWLHYRARPRDRTSMPFVVTENCIKCKYTDCVEVCPVDCFHEGPNFLVIDPDECIDCTLCEPECPINAIYPGGRRARRAGSVRRAQRRTGQGMAGDHRAQGSACRTPRTGKASPASCRCWSADPHRRTAPGQPDDRTCCEAAREPDRRKRAPEAPVSASRGRPDQSAPSAAFSAAISLAGASPVAGMPRGSTADT